MKVVILALISVLTLTACSERGAAFVFYVVIKPDEAAKFIAAVKAIAKEDGLATAVGQAESDTGDVLRVVEGRGSGLELWVQNATRGGDGDSKLCGVRDGPYPDPAQFIVFTAPRFFGSKAKAIELGERVFSQIQKSGFDVRREEPATCGAAAIRDR
jgi:hypothetical protein